MRVALGTAIVLGLEKRIMDTAPTTAHFLIGDDCSFSCTYCNSKDSRIARIDWPEFSDEQVLNLPITKFKRACLQLTSNGLSDAMKIIPRIKIPTSVSIRTENPNDARNLFDAGADRVCLPLDACTELIGKNVGRQDYETTMKLLESLSKEYPGKISTHSIIGLGETEREAIDQLQKVCSINVKSGLFAFTPVKGTPLEDRHRPNICSYRRIQIAKYLIDHDKEKTVFKYNRREQLVGISSGNGDNHSIIPDVPSTAFETSGCTDCNRPYFDSSPGKIYNYPRPLNNDEWKTALRQAHTYEGHNIYKAEKLIRINLEYSNVIESIKITGDFFIYPEESIQKLESILINCPIENETIKKTITAGLSGADAFGFDANSLTEAIMGAVK